MQADNLHTKNESKKLIRFGFVESAMQIVRDCESGDPSRHLYCILSHVIGSISAILLPIIIVIGAIGNSLVAHAMLRRLRPLSRQNLYLGCIAIADTISLVVIGIFNGFLTKGLSWITRGKFGFFSYNLNDVACKISRYAMNFCHALSCMWLLVLVTDRVLVVRRPLMMRKVGIKWAVRALIASFVLAAMIALPNGILVGHETVHMPGGIVLIYCYHSKETQLLMLAYTTVMSNPPLIFIVLMLGLNVFLLYEVTSAVKKRKLLYSTTSNNSTGNGSAQKLSGTMLVLILSIIYFLLTLPLMIMRPVMEISIYLLDIAENLDYLVLITNLAYTSLTLALVNQCVNFFVLYKRSAAFRHCLKSFSNGTIKADSKSG